MQKPGKTRTTITGKAICKKWLFLQQGDIVLVRFPFSNLIDYKIRPALIVSNNRHNKQSDAWICPLTTTKGIKSVPVQHALVEGKLEKESYAKTNVIATIEEDLIIKKIGKISNDKTAEVIEEIMADLK